MKTPADINKHAMKPVASDDRQVRAQAAVDNLGEVDQKANIRSGLFPTLSAVFTLSPEGGI